jgi:hypothetical protein
MEPSPPGPWQISVMKPLGCSPAPFMWSSAMRGEAEAVIRPHLADWQRIQVLSAQLFLGATPKLLAPAAWLASLAPQAMRTLSYFLISQHLGSFSEVSRLPSNQ